MAADRNARSRLGLFQSQGSGKVGHSSRRHQIPQKEFLGAYIMHYLQRNEVGLASLKCER